MLLLRKIKFSYLWLKEGIFYPIMKLLLLLRYHVETGNKASIVCKESLNETESNFEDCSIYIAQKFKRGASSLSVSDLMLKYKQSAFLQRRRAFISLS